MSDYEQHHQIVGNLDANINDFTFPSTEQRYKVISTCISNVHVQELDYTCIIYLL